jgi:hypothetical protein
MLEFDCIGAVCYRAGAVGLIDAGVQREGRTVSVLPVWLTVKSRAPRLRLPKTTMSFITMCRRNDTLAAGPSIRQSPVGFCRSFELVDQKSVLFQLRAEEGM